MTKLSISYVCFIAIIIIRYGSCVPFLPYLLGRGIPCDSVYKSGTDYVYIENSSESLQPLNVIGEVEDVLQVESSLNDFYCMNLTIHLICHYYLPSCGNSTHFKPPTFVCSDACHLLSQMCPTHWGAYESKLKGKSNPLNCSYIKQNTDPLNHSCSDLGVYTSEFCILGTAEY